MTKAERKAMESYKKDLIKQGVEPEMAAILAKTLTECKIIVPVVNER